MCVSLLLYSVPLYVSDSCVVCVSLCCCVLSLCGLTTLLLCVSLLLLSEASYPIPSISGVEQFASLYNEHASVSVPGRLEPGVRCKRPRFYEKKKSIRRPYHLQMIGRYMES